jgi:hypothetical protein
MKPAAFAAAVSGSLSERANDLVGIGHNAPPNGAEEHKAVVDALIANANRWLTERPEIKTDDEAGDLEDFDRQLLAWQGKLKRQKAEDTFALTAALDRIREAYNPLETGLGACRKLLAGIRTAYLVWKDTVLAKERAAARRAADEAQREAEEAAKKAEAPKTVADIIRAQEAAQRAAEAAQAAAAVPARAQVRGAISGRARSLRTTWRAAVVDLIAAARHYRERAEMLELVERLANADARAGVRQIPGCAVYSTQE